jgi:hypothetical protein
MHSKNGWSAGFPTMPVIAGLPELYRNLQEMCPLTSDFGKIQAGIISAADLKRGDSRLMKFLRWISARLFGTKQ